MKILIKGDPDYHVPINENFAEGEQALKTAIADVRKWTDSTFQKILKNELLWSGGWVMGSAHTVTPKKKISNCNNGWLLVFQSYENGNVPGTEFQYSYVPKQHVDKYAATGIVFPIANYNGSKTGVKYLYIRDDTIKGNELNAQAPNNIKILSDVYEF